MAVSGMAIGGNMARALGLPPDTTDIQIHIPLEGPVSVTCRYYPNQEAMDNLLACMRHYHVVVVNGTTLMDDARSLPAEDV